MLNKLRTLIARITGIKEADAKQLQELQAKVAELQGIINQADKIIVDALTELDK